MIFIRTIKIGDSLSGPFYDKKHYNKKYGTHIRSLKKIERYVMRKESINWGNITIDRDMDPPSFDWRFSYISIPVLMEDNENDV